MKQTLLFCLLIIYCSISALDFTSSNLPIVIINTDNSQAIPDDPKVLASMKIISRGKGQRNYVSDKDATTYLNYNGRIGIELRGSSSQDLPKKPYSITTFKSDNVTNNNVSLLGMPKENDWVLNSLAFDISLLRDFFSFDLARDCGDYASRGVYCEVIINDDYKGLYILGEKIKIDEDRVNIEKLTNLSSDITGGYLFKADKTTGNDYIVSWTNNSYLNDIVNYIIDNPKAVDITTAQTNYIKNYFNNFGSQSKNNSILNGYPSYIDIPTFVDFFILNEIAGNVDGYQFSTYFHKDKKGKLRAGPIWDFNLSYGNDLFIWGFNRSFYNVWQFDNGDNVGSRFWKDLYNETKFRFYLKKRWTDLRSKQIIEYNRLCNKIDSIQKNIAEASDREASRWGTFNSYSHNMELSNMKTWINQRINWIDREFSDFLMIYDISTPNLVISKINYHPAVLNGFSSDSLEFLEITNNSTKTIDLTGVYLSELGNSYSFPNNYQMGQDAKIYLASNANVFQKYYGFKPLGEYSRPLSNKSQKIVLSDAFGNVIDSVRYMDSGKWPLSADGTGDYLELSNISLDNSLAENWIASSNTITNIFESNTNETLILNVYPNPCKELLTISSEKQMESIVFYDVYGRVVLKQNINAFKEIININSFNQGLYLIKITLINGETISKVIVKE